MNPYCAIQRKARAFRHRIRSEGLILLYHRVARTEVDPWNLCVSPQNFSDHLEVLKKFRPTRLVDLPARGGLNSIVITFDDGYADNLHSAAPLLERHEIPATFFITTGYLGQGREFWWDELERRVAVAARTRRTLELRLANRLYNWDFASLNGGRNSWLPVYYAIYDLLQPLADRERHSALQSIEVEDFNQARQSHRVLSMDELSQLSSHRLFDVGAHTVTHPRLSACSRREQLDEMQQSRRFLENSFGRPIKTFSYPYGGAGHYSDESVEIACEVGFSMACTTNGSIVKPASSRFELPRMVIEDCTGDRFEATLHSHMNKN